LVGSWGYSETFSFTNSNPFVFSQTRSSSLPVSGVVGHVVDVNVTLSGMKTNSGGNGVEEFDVLLVGPQGTSIILISFVCDSTLGPVDFTLDDAASNFLPMGDIGIVCSSGVYKPSDYHENGDGYIIDSPPAPTPPYSIHLSDLNNLNPNGTWKIYAEEFEHDEGGTIESWTVSIQTDNVESCTRFDDEFDDNIVDWNIIKPNAIENGGNTTLIPVKRKGELEADNVFAGCGSNCIINTAFQTSGGLGSKVSLIGWYVNKANLIEVLIKEDKDRIIIRQRKDNTVVRKSSADFTINPNTVYSVKMIYDGTTITVLIDDTSPSLSIKPVGSLSGSVGIRSTNTTSIFTHMCVD
jgi:hypothetical protein